MILKYQRLPQGCIFDFWIIDDLKSRYKTVYVDIIYTVYTDGFEIKIKNSKLGFKYRTQQYWFVCP